MSTSPQQPVLARTREPNTCEPQTYPALEAAIAALAPELAPEPESLGEIHHFPTQRTQRRTPRGRARTRAIQLALPLDWSLPSGASARPHLVAVPSAATTSDEGAVPAEVPADLPNPAQWAAHMARALVEASVGERPAAQLTRWVSHEVLGTLTRRGAAARRHPSHSAASRLRQVRGVRCCVVSAGVVETSAVVVGPQRASAVAMRLEARGNRWVVTEVELG